MSRQSVKVSPGMICERPAAIKKTSSRTTGDHLCSITTRRPYKRLPQADRRGFVFAFIFIPSLSCKKSHATLKYNTSTRVYNVRFIEWLIINNLILVHNLEHSILCEGYTRVESRNQNSVSPWLFLKPTTLIGNISVLSKLSVSKKLSIGFYQL